jgi:predicted O-methyltransferase YrrM
VEVAQTLGMRIRNLGRKLAPEWTLKGIRVMRLMHRARRLGVAAERVHRPAGWVDLVFGYEDFRPLQVRSEITALLERVELEPPMRVLEIGSALGGTAFLFSRVALPGATIVLVDRMLGRARRAAIRQFVRRHQRVICVSAGSQEPDTVAHVAAMLRGAPVDFLFIDADHSYSGVAADFENYSRLVRKGGLIAFHDIVPDHWKRFGQRTSGDAGEVFRFWRELKARRGSAATEFVEDPDQDGAGIGVVSW